MKNGVGHTVGKTITKVVVAKRKFGPEQVFMIFSDETYFEFWGNEFNCAGGIDGGGLESVLAYVKRAGSDVTAVYPSAA